MTIDIAKLRELCRSRAHSCKWNITPENTAFIAAARTALPAALDEIERLTAERDAATRDARQYQEFEACLSG